MEPQHVDRRALFFRCEPCRRTHYCMATIGTHNEIRANLQRTMRRHCVHALDHAHLLNQAGHFSLPAQCEMRIYRGLPRQKIQKIPLRHEHEKLAECGQVREIGQRHGVPVYLPLHARDLLVRQREEGFENAQLVHHFERGRMNGVAAKVAEEVRVLFEDHDVDARTRQQITQHHPGGAAAGDATSGGDGCGHGALARGSIMALLGKWRHRTGVLLDRAFVGLA